MRWGPAFKYQDSEQVEKMPFVGIQRTQKSDARIRLQLEFYDISVAKAHLDM